MKGKHFAAAAAAFAVAVTMAGCSAPTDADNNDNNYESSEGLPEVPPAVDVPEEPEIGRAHV